MAIVRIVSNGALAEILGVLSFMQLVVYLPLIDVKFPAHIFLCPKPSEFELDVYRICGECPFIAGSPKLHA